MRVTVPGSRGRSTMDERSARDDEARQTAALMGAYRDPVVLAIAGVVLVRELTANAKLEDCLMSGRRNCAPIEVRP